MSNPHDGFAGTWVISEKKAKGLTGQHGFVDRGNLMGQRLDDRGVYGEHRIEEMRKADPLRFGDQAEQRAVSVEAHGRPASTISSRASS